MKFLGKYDNINNDVNATRTVTEDQGATLALLQDDGTGADGNVTTQPPGTITVYVQLHTRQMFSSKSRYILLTAWLISRLG